MTLTLEITAPSGGNSGNPTRHVFNEEGGTIGRHGRNSWVLPHKEVSADHAVISFRNGVFYIQDTSRNGVSVNSPDNRLGRDGTYALKPGDRIFIPAPRQPPDAASSEPYVIDVSIDASPSHDARRPPPDPFGLEDSFKALPPSPSGPSNRGSSPEVVGGDEVDPLKIFKPRAKPAPPRQPEVVRPPVDALLGAHYEAPAVLPGPTPSGPDSGAIPPGYDPIRDVSSPSPGSQARPRSGVDSAVLRARAKEVALPDATPLPPSAPTIRQPPEVAGHTVPPAPRAAEPAPRAVEPSPRAADSAPREAQSPARPAEPAPPAAGPAPRAAEPAARAVSGVDYLAELLTGAGLVGAAVTPELTRDFGQILRVVVAGLMDVLRARQRIKEEFGMRQTMFRPADNNPLKFSANVEDALHNLLVKRNTAYLGPVDAFADAFDDLRDHQLAMLAGMRVAFEGMLAEFDPDQLQEEFDRQLSKGSFPLMPAKLRYWDLYRERRSDVVKDPDAAFSRLFGEEFARAYEEQFRRLKAGRRSGSGERPAQDTRPPQE